MLGPSTPLERLNEIDGEIVNRSMLPVSYTFDHRAIPIGAPN